MVIDDEPEICNILKEFLEGLGYQVLTAHSGPEGLNLISQNVVDVLILDLNMPGMHGLEVLKKVKYTYPDISVIVLTGFPSIDTAVESMKLGAYDYLIKPIDFKRLEVVLDKVFEQILMKRRLDILERKVRGDYIFEGMVGQSIGMLNVFHMIKQIAPYSTNVLITGETGTGKEMVAHAIHNLSPRINKPFVVINCAGLVDTLLESELFGHVKGAFTGAVKDKPGLFEVANEGTIFLDEIGELPLGLQAKLLRVLEYREIQRIGDTKTRKVNVRIIAATNVDLKSKVEEEKYRKDLFFRLNSFCIHIPPLRERKEDIPLLCQHFINQLNAELKKDIKGVSQNVLDLFMELPWEGNVRELRNVIERSYIMAKGEFIDIADLPAEYREIKGKNHFSDTKQNINDIDILEESPTTLEELEKRYIAKVLKMTSGNRSKAAKILGLSRRSLYRKLKRYGLF